MMKRFLYLIVLCLTLTGCTEGHGFFRETFKPTPFRMGKAPDGPPDYKSGWNDGCETGLATMTSNYYKTFYKFKQDPKMIHNKMYYQAWKDSYTYCRQYMFRWVLWKLDNREPLW